jgi:hypothetical protein
MRVFDSLLDTIWKFAIPQEADFTLEMPKGAVPLSVGVQGDQPVMWAAVNASTLTFERHRFILRGTGHPLPGLLAYRFIGTFQLSHLGLVFHLFDAGPIEPLIRVKEESAERGG